MYSTKAVSLTGYDARSDELSSTSRPKSFQSLLGMFWRKLVENLMFHSEKLIVEDFPEKACQ